MTNNEARQNYLVSMEQNKAGMMLYQCIMMEHIALKADQAFIKASMVSIHSHWRNLCETINGYKGIPANDEEFKGV